MSSPRIGGSRGTKGSPPSPKQSPKQSAKGVSPRMGFSLPDLPKSKRINRSSDATEKSPEIQKPEPSPRDLRQRRFGRTGSQSTEGNSRLNPAQRTGSLGGEAVPVARNLRQEFFSLGLCVF